MQMRPTSRAVAKPATGKVVDPAKLARLSDIAPYVVTPLDVKAPAGFWPFNPSIHFDGTTWRCAVRCADYAMPGGVQIRSESANPLRSVTVTAMAELDPATWAIKSTTIMREVDQHPRREGANHSGFEDMRLFNTADGGLWGIAASLQLGGVDAPKTPEQVLVAIDDQYKIIDVHPIRGIWNSGPQKNWAPFNGAVTPRFLYSIDQGIVFDVEGPVTGWPEPAAPAISQPRAASHGGTEVIMRRKTIVVSAGKSMGRPDYVGLRGGSQLTYLPGFVINPEVSSASEAWLGIGHSMQFINGKKFYWHSFYAVDENGVLLARSQPFKLASEGIEFAAGMAIENDRVAISFGVDDMASRIGETSLAAIMELFATANADGTDGKVIASSSPVARMSARPQGPIGAVIDAAQGAKAPLVAKPASSPAAPAAPKPTAAPSFKPLSDADLDAIEDIAELRGAYRKFRDYGSPKMALEAMAAASGAGGGGAGANGFISRIGKNTVR